MDNNQQGKEGGVDQPSAATTVVEQAGPEASLTSPGTTDLGVNNAGKLSVGTPFTGKDVSMTTPQNAGGAIASTESGSHA